MRRAGAQATGPGHVRTPRLPSLASVLLNVRARVVMTAEPGSRVALTGTRVLLVQHCAELFAEHSTVRCAQTAKAIPRGPA